MGIGETIGYLLVAFATSALIGYLVTERRRSRLGTPPEVGTTLRLRSTSGVYRSKLMAIAGNEWSISAPLSRNHYIPLRVDESLTVEAPVKGGVYVFKTVVCGRDNENHEFKIRPPVNISPRDRREVKRCERSEPAQVDGHPAHLVDISALGARLKTARRLTVGDRIRLDLADGMLFAWVLESWPTRHGDDWREVVRVRFETTHESAC